MRLGTAVILHTLGWLASGREETGRRSSLDRAMRLLADFSEAVRRIQRCGAQVSAHRTGANLGTFSGVHPQWMFLPHGYGHWWGGDAIGDYLEIVEAVYGFWGDIEGRRCLAGIGDAHGAVVVSARVENVSG